MDLKSKRKGFSGVTHMLIALCLFMIILLIPIDLFKDYVTKLKSNIIFMVVAFTIIAGASLLPDLDNHESTAGYQLGFVGSIMKLFMTITSSIIFTLYRLKNDKEPVSMHRMFWHTPFSAMIFILLFLFIPKSNQVFGDMIIKAFKNKNLIEFVFEFTTPMLCLFLGFVSSLLGSNMLLYWPLKLFHVDRRTKSLIHKIIPILILIFSFNLTLNELRYIGITIGLGYMFHIIGDLFSQGSVPIIWPIPIKGQAYWKPWILGPFQIRTGGIVNMILNYGLLVVNFILFYVIFF